MTQLGFFEHEDQDSDLWDYLVDLKLQESKQLDGSNIKI